MENLEDVLTPIFYKSNRTEITKLFQMYVRPAFLISVLTLNTGAHDPEDQINRMVERGENTNIPFHIYLQASSLAEVANRFFFELLSLASQSLSCFS